MRLPRFEIVEDAPFSTLSWNNCEIWPLWNREDAESMCGILNQVLDDIEASNLMKEILLEREILMDTAVDCVKRKYGVDTDLFLAMKEMKDFADRAVSVMRSIRDDMEESSPLYERLNKLLHEWDETEGEADEEIPRL